MIISEKIKALRKSESLSQEDLAEKLNISRQSVSKWEMQKSIPDLDRIVDLSKIFKVSVDFLLDDEKDLDDIEIKENIYKFNLDKAENFLKENLLYSKSLANSISIYIISVIPSLLIEHFTDNQSLTDIVSSLSLFLLIAFASINLYSASQKMEKFKFMEDNFTYEYGLTGILKERKENFRNDFFKFIVGAIFLIIASLVLVIAVDGQSSLIEDLVNAVFLIAISISVNIFIRYLQIIDGFEDILQEDSYSLENKKIKKEKSHYMKIYGLLVLIGLILTLVLINNYFLIFAYLGIALIGYFIMKIILQAMA